MGEKSPFYEGLFMPILTKEEYAILLLLLDQALLDDAKRAHELCRIERKLIEGMVNKDETHPQLQQ